MQCLTTNRKRSLLIVSLMLALSLLLTTGVGAARTAALREAASAGNVPYGGGPVPGGPGFVSVSSMSFRPYIPYLPVIRLWGSGLKNTGAFFGLFYAHVPDPERNQHQSNGGLLH